MSDTTRAVKLWEVALRQVEKLPAGSPRAGSSQQQHAAGASLKPVDDVLPTVDKFLELPRLHAAVYTKLVADLKVRGALWQPVCSADNLLPVYM